MDRALRHADAEGLDPMTAIQMGTNNTAEHFGLTRELGMIAPGRWADILLVEDLRDFHPEMVVAKGQVIAQKGKWTTELPSFSYPKWAVNSVNLKRDLQADDFVMQVKNRKGKVKANVIGVIENQAPTRHLTFELEPVDGVIKTDISRDIAKVAVVERHKGTGAVALGLVSGFGFERKCAIASTVAHDCHHLVIVGTDDASMAEAANSLARSGGGQVVVVDGKVRARIELPIAGLMSAERADVVAKKAATVLDGFRTCGCQLNNPNMQLSLLALVVIPELRISDLGLVDVANFKFIPVVE
jgi:adenine deaminase